MIATDDARALPRPFAPSRPDCPPTCWRARDSATPGRRDDLLFRGPLRAALRLGHQVASDWFAPRSPDLLWPADRTWCLATEIDFDSTLVGGSQEFVAALLRAPELEAWPVEADADLTYGGDLVNR